MPLTGALSLLPDNPTSAYIIQFTSGPDLGRCRLLSSITTNAIGFAALPSAPGVGSTFEIYRFMGKKLMDKADRLLTLPDDFDAPTDGVTSANTAITNALSSGRVVDGCGLTYKLTSAITITGIGSKLQNCTIDVSAITASTPYSPVYAVTIQGTQGSAVSLTANHTGAQNYFQVGSNTTFVDDAYLLATSTSIWSSLPEQTNTYGMLCKVWKKNGSNRVDLRETHQLDFLTANAAAISPVSMVEGVLFRNVYWQGVPNVGGGNVQTGTYVAQSALRLIRCVNPQILGGGSRDINGVAFNLNACWGAKIDSLDIQRGRTQGADVPDENESGSVGVLLDGGTSRCVVDNVIATDIAVGVKIAGYDRICRYNTVTNFIGASVREVGIYVGSATDFTEISNNQVEIFADAPWSGYTHGVGIYARGNNVDIHHNLISSPATYGIVYEATRAQASVVNISDNIIKANTAYADVDAVIRIVTGTAATYGAIDSFSVSNNQAYGAGVNGIHIWSSAAKINNGTIRNNHFAGYTASSEAVWMYQQTTNGGINTTLVEGGDYTSNGNYGLSMQSDGLGTTKISNSFFDNIVLRGTMGTSLLRFAGTIDCGYNKIRSLGSAPASFTESSNTRLLREGYYVKTETIADTFIVDTGRAVVVANVPGAKLHQPVQVSFDGDSEFTLYEAWVSAADTVTVYLNNFLDGDDTKTGGNLLIYVKNVLL